MTTDKNEFIVRISVPADQPITDVKLPTNENVESFTVTVRRPNGEDLPVKDGRVGGSLKPHSGILYNVLLN